MNKSLSIFTFLVALNATASAQEIAEAVRTSGTAELSRVADHKINPCSHNIPIHLPTTVSKGEVISIQYEISGNKIADSFMVTGITVSGDTCAIESKHHTADGESDMIFAQSCRKLR